MEPRSLEIFDKALSVVGLKVQVVRNREDCLPLLDGRLRGMLFESFSYAAAFDFLLRRVQNDMMIHLRDEYDLQYFYLSVPPEQTDSQEQEILAIGPLQSKPHTREETLAILERNHLPGKLLTELWEFYNTLPAIEDVDAVECLIQYLASGVFTRPYHLNRFPELDGAFPVSYEKVREVHENPRQVWTDIEQRYSLENRLLEAIGAGDFEKAREQYGKLQRCNIPARAENPLDDWRHRTVILNSLCRKAVEVAGVHPLYIDDLSTRFAYEIGRRGTVQELDQLMASMIRGYCTLVNDHAMKGYSPIVKQIISYIDFHYIEELSLAYFAKMFNMSKTYLSNLFRKETGTTLTEFIHQVRLRRAILLLNASSLSITAIATACGYNDINYFIRRFRKAYGLSPKQYQKVMQQTAFLYEKEENPGGEEEKQSPDAADAEGNCADCTTLEA